MTGWLSPYCQRKAFSFLKAVALARLVASGSLKECRVLLYEACKPSAAGLFFSCLSWWKLQLVATANCRFLTSAGDEPTGCLTFYFSCTECLTVLNQCTVVHVLILCCTLITPPAFTCSPDLSITSGGSATNHFQCFAFPRQKKKPLIPCQRTKLVFYIEVPPSAGESISVATCLSPVHRVGVTSLSLQTEFSLNLFSEMDLRLSM